jgi:hypothetical protein
VTVSYFGTQNHAGYGLLVAPQNQREDEDGVGHALRSNGLLHMKVSWVRIFQSGLKTDEGVTASGACVTITEVTSSSSRRRTGRYDRLHRTLLPPHLPFLY